MSSTRVTVLPSFLDTSACNNLLNVIEQIGYEDQYSGEGRLLRSRCHFEHKGWSNHLWELLIPHLPTLTTIYTDDFSPEPMPSVPLEDYQPEGLNTFLRCYRYGVDQQFRRHEDIAYEFDSHRRTFYTVLIYLNEGYVGGETSFEGLVVKPELGMLVMFPHELPHEGRLIQEGIKYTLRTDVVFAC